MKNYMRPSLIQFYPVHFNKNGRKEIVFINCMVDDGKKLQENTLEKLIEDKTIQFNEDQLVDTPEIVIRALFGEKLEYEDDSDEE